MKKLTTLLKDNKTGPLIVIGLFGLLIIIIPVLISVISNNKNKPQYIQGDFSNFACEVKHCSNSPTWKLTSYAQISTYYYCDEHESEGRNLYERYTKPSKNKDTVKDKYGHDRFDAIVIAEKIVENNLKSPSTAKFCGNSDYTVTCLDNTWTVKGYVDAQNSFGAVLRNDFTVKFTFSNEDKYTIDLCELS